MLSGQKNVYDLSGAKRVSVYSSTRIFLLLRAILMLHAHNRTLSGTSEAHRVDKETLAVIHQSLSSLSNYYHDHPSPAPSGQFFRVPQRAGDPRPLYPVHEEEGCRTQRPFAQDSCRQSRYPPMSSPCTPWPSTRSRIVSLLIARRSDRSCPYHRAPH
ncbi:hypothetical protein B0H12DRAFT_459048 [Mycena haematopus]|nr:hypothetical protein B0H12DRAFT_459048 [Mycena haematopus]